MAAGLAFTGAATFADAGLLAFHGGGGGLRVGFGGISKGRGTSVTGVAFTAPLAPVPRLKRDRPTLNPQAQLSIRHMGQSPDPEEPEPSPTKGTAAGRGLFTPPLFTIDRPSLLPSDDSVADISKLTI